MKKFLIILIAFFLICGLYYYNESDMASENPEIIRATRSSSLINQGTWWGDDKILTEISSPIDDDWSDKSCAMFCGQLMFYGYQYNEGIGYTMKIVTVDLYTGEVKASAMYKLSHAAFPQIYRDHIYLCDNTLGRVLEIGENLAVTDEWFVQPNESYWFIGCDLGVFFHEDLTFYYYDLNNGGLREVLKNCEYVRGDIRTQFLSVAYYRHGEHGLSFEALDLRTGAFVTPKIDIPLAKITCFNQMWLYECGNRYNVLYLDNGDVRYRMKVAHGSYIELLQEGYLLMREWGEGTKLHLYTPEGKRISTCVLSSEQPYYLTDSPIWVKELGGYFLPVEDYDGVASLLFWDLRKSAEGQDLAMTPVLKMPESLRDLRIWANQIGRKYGISIYFAEDYTEDFEDFRGNMITDYKEIYNELLDLELALSKYPDGLFRDIQRWYASNIEIYFMQDLQVKNEEGWYIPCNTYSEVFGMVYMACDILDTDATSYYHEFSHVIEKYMEEKIGYFSNDSYCDPDWDRLNPEGFSYGDVYDTHEWDYYSEWFTNRNATKSPSEDRAHLMQYAMMPYHEVYFREGTALYEKLKYYSECIRDAFSTTEWPEKTEWEQYLN